MWIADDGRIMTISLAPSDTPVERIRELLERLSPGRRARLQQRLDQRVDEVYESTLGASLPAGWGAPEEAVPYAVVESIDWESVLSWPISWVPLAIDIWGLDLLLLLDERL